MLESNKIKQYFHASTKKFCRLHYELVSRCDTELKDLLQGLSEPEFYSDLVCKLRKSVGKLKCSDQFSKIHMLLTFDVIKLSACLAVDPITVEYFAFLFNCTPVNRDLDSIMAPT